MDWTATRVNLGVNLVFHCRLSLPSMYSRKRGEKEERKNESLIGHDLMLSATKPDRDPPNGALNCAPSLFVTLSHRPPSAVRVAQRCRAVVVVYSFTVTAFGVLKLDGPDHSQITSPMSPPLPSSTAGEPWLGSGETCWGAPLVG